MLYSRRMSLVHNIQQRISEVYPQDLKDRVRGYPNGVSAQTIKKKLGSQYSKLSVSTIQSWRKDSGSPATKAVRTRSGKGQKGGNTYYFNITHHHHRDGGGTRKEGRQKPKEEPKKEPETTTSGPFNNKVKDPIRLTQADYQTVVARGNYRDNTNTHPTPDAGSAEKPIDAGGKYIVYRKGGQWYKALSVDRVQKFRGGKTIPAKTFEKVTDPFESSRIEDWYNSKRKKVSEGLFRHRAGALQKTSKEKQFTDRAMADWYKHPVEGAREGDLHKRKGSRKLTREEVLQTTRYDWKNTPSLLDLRTKIMAAQKKARNHVRQSKTRLGFIPRSKSSRTRALGLGHQGQSLDAWLDTKIPHKKREVSRRHVLRTKTHALHSQVSAEYERKTELPFFKHNKSPSHNPHLLEALSLLEGSEYEALMQVRISVPGTRKTVFVATALKNGRHPAHTQAVRMLDNYFRNKARRNSDGEVDVPEDGDTEIRKTSKDEHEKRVREKAEKAAKSAADPLELQRLTDALRPSFDADDLNTFQQIISGKEYSFEAIKHFANSVHYTGGKTKKATINYLIKVINDSIKRKVRR